MNYPLASDDLSPQELAAISHSTVQLGLKDPHTSVASIVGWAEEQTLIERMLERSVASGVDTTVLRVAVSGHRTAVANVALAAWASQLEPIRQRGWEWDGPNGWSGLLTGFVEFANRSGHRYLRVWA